MNLTPKIKEVLTILIKEEKINFNRSYNNNNHSYNCFSFAGYVSGWTTCLSWLNSWDGPERWIREESIKVETPEKGDIAVYYRCGSLTHMAVLVDPATETFIHKPGGLQLEILTKAQIHNRYSNVYGEIREFRRAV